MKDLRIALTGASGFIGTRLKKIIGQPVVIQREDSLETIRAKLQGVDAVINLAGAPIIKRWTSSYKQTLVSSRINTTRKLVEAMKGTTIRHFISTSATGIYPNDKECDESCPEVASDFLGKLAKQWEEEALKCEKKTAILRLGVVLGKEGGALKKMLLPFKLGLGGPIGDGSMIMSWIDIEDLVRIYSFILDQGSSGIFNAVSPRPVTNREFSKELGRILKRPTLFPVPRIVLRLLYGQAASVLTASKIVYPSRLLNEGFRFLYPDISSCLSHIFST